MKIKNQPFDTSIRQSGLSVQSQTNLTQFYGRNLLKTVKNHPYYKLACHQNQQPSISLLNGQKLIKPKMFNKVVLWMQKLCIETLNFSPETFQLSVRILKQYLQNSQEHPSTLQMLACIALHIASKINQKTIIAVESYIQCCMNIFNKAQFQQKQAQFYQAVAFKMPSVTFHNVLEFLQFQLQEKKHITQGAINRLKTVMQEIVKTLQLLDKDPFSVVINLWVQILANEEYKFDREDFLYLICKRKIQY